MPVIVLTELVIFSTSLSNLKGETVFMGANVSRSNRKMRRRQIDEPTRIALSLLPAIQAVRGDFQAVDVQNHTESDQRRMVRSGEKRTIRRRSHIDHIAHRIGLDEREASACQWYADTHAQRYDTVNVIGSYGDGCRTTKTNFDHLPSTNEQDIAAEHFYLAREAIAPVLRKLFDRVVIEGWTMLDRQAEALFRLATRQLMHRIEGFVALCD